MFTILQKVVFKRGVRFKNLSVQHNVFTVILSFRSGLNDGVFVTNDPVNFVDPWGLWENPVEFWKDFGGGSKDFLDNYEDMRDANTIGGDKYFHCKANCQAAKRGLGGETAAETISEGRELVDEYIKGDLKQQCNDDRAANQQGRNYDPNKSCKDQCKSLRPNGLDPRGN